MSEETEMAAADSMFRCLVEQTLAGIYVIQEGYFRYVNPVFAEMFGYKSPADLINRIPVSDLVAPADRERVADNLRRRVEGEVKDIRYSFVGLRRDGTTIDIEVHGGLLEYQAKPAVIGLALDITERKRAEDEMRLASMVYQSSSEAMMVTDADGGIISTNPAFTTITGYTPDEVIGKNSRLLNSRRHDQAFYLAMWQALRATGHWQGEIWNRRKNGEIYPEWLTINTIFNQDGSAHRRVALFSDITEKKASEALIWQQANFDSLTGLPNRRMFHDRLVQDMKKAHRSGLPLALMFLDLDHFKEVNDILGHDMGDILLQEAAWRLSRCVRESDTVARLGGDEFTIILGDLDNPDSVRRVAYDILQKLAAPFQLGNEIAYVSASIGITMYPEDASDPKTLLKNADQAMYAAKNQGHNCFSFFTPAMRKAHSPKKG
ncbi:MAG TPA: diguanylate cyclase [Novimethylophilus sp.]|jgi:diguanylate cyclase (GGDEF)-like protein/PAS domain S-box-containing protein|uniref:sensor domain-containing protein n=1 Tax=Novimethylophilus sp. TaxID=2137426 RepID=UPI002F3F2DC4